MIAEYSDLLLREDNKRAEVGDLVESALNLACCGIPSPRIFRSLSVGCPFGLDGFAQVYRRRRRARDVLQTLYTTELSKRVCGVSTSG